MRQGDLYTAFCKGLFPMNLYSFDIVFILDLSFENFRVLSESRSCTFIRSNRQTRLNPVCCLPLYFKKIGISDYLEVATAFVAPHEVDRTAQHTSVVYRIYIFIV